MGVYVSVSASEYAFYNSLLQYVNDFNGKQAHPAHSVPQHCTAQKLITNYYKQPKQEGTS